MLKEIFRYSQSFAHTDQLNNSMQEQDWYEFTRVLVNTMSHSGKLDIYYEKNLKNKLPITYKNHLITEDMHGKNIPATLDLVYELSEAVISWVKTVKTHRD